MRYGIGSQANIDHLHGPALVVLYVGACIAVVITIAFVVFMVRKESEIS